MYVPRSVATGWGRLLPLGDRYQTAAHTVVLSDLHLTEAEPVDPDWPLWKRYKHRDLFVDDDLAAFLRWIVEHAEGEIELVLNGDVFDFDAVTSVPDIADFHVSWIERRRGLAADEDKSRYKIWRILRDHKPFVSALRAFLVAGNRVVFITGNHDIELHWPGVREEILVALDLPEEHGDAVRFCEWFYVSNGDTLLEHGNQYDAYCMCADPVHPFISWGRSMRVRLPFGNVAARYMMNGMGLFNPHVDDSWILSPVGYLKFFFRYMMRIQPFIVLTWLWGATATLIVVLRDGFAPAVKDPLHIVPRVEGIAHRANVKPTVVFALHALKVHPAHFNPFKILRELWLDRAVLLALLCFGCVQVISALNLFVTVSAWWALAPFLLLLPVFVFYARSVNSDVNNVERACRVRLPIAAQITGVRRVVLGHTHREGHALHDSLEVINTGTWSPAFRDVECTVPFGLKCFAWIQPGPEGRTAELYAWSGGTITRIEPRQVSRIPRWRFVRRFAGDEPAPWRPPRRPPSPVAADDDDDVRIEG